MSTDIGRRDFTNYRISIMKEFKPFKLPVGEWTQADKDLCGKRHSWRRTTILSRHGQIYFNQWFESLEPESIELFEEAMQFLVSEYVKKADKTLFGMTAKDLPVSTTYILETLDCNIMFFLRIGKVDFEEVGTEELGLRARLVKMYARKLLAKVYRSKSKAEWLKGIAK